MFLRRVTFAACVLLSAPAVAYSQNPIAGAARASETIVVDGILEDAVWAVAPAESEFTQRDPDEGKPATERTELRIAYDEANIYFGVRLFDREPSGNVQRRSRRDD